MNGDDVKWLEKLFEQHKEDQQKYLDSKFEAVATQIKELKDSVGDLQEDIEDVEVTALALIDDAEEATNKKVVLGSGVAVLIALASWTIFGTDAVRILTGFIGRLFIGG